VKHGQRLREGRGGVGVTWIGGNELGRKTAANDLAGGLGLLGLVPVPVGPWPGLHGPGSGFILEENGDPLGGLVDLRRRQG
jgi:hypothetical protein